MPEPPQPFGDPMAYDIQAFHETVNQSAIMAYELGSYVPESAYWLINSAGIATDQIPKFSNRDPANSSDGAEMDPVTETETSIQISLDTPLKRWQYMTKEQINKVGPQVAAQLGQKLGTNVATGMSNRIAAGMAITALTGSNIATFNDEATDTDTWVDAAEEAQRLLDDDKVPGGNRFGLVSPKYFRKIARSHFYGSSDFRKNADNDDQFNSFTAAGVTWIAWPSPIFSANLSANTDYPSKYRRNFSGDRLYGIVFSGDAFAVKMAETLNVSIDWVPERRSNLICAAVHFGTATLQAEGFAAIVGDAGTE